MNTKRPKTGGRKKGVQNKITSDLKSWLSKLVDDNRTTFETDLKKLDSAQRLQILERLMQYVTPKMQSVSVEAQIQAEYDSLRKLLEESPDEVLDKLEQRILTLKSLENEQRSKD